MKRLARPAARTVFSRGILVSLGFGAVQLTAAPASAAVRACFDEYCDDLCVMKGWSGGYCRYTELRCLCYRWATTVELLEIGEGMRTLIQSGPAGCERPCLRG